VTRAVFEKARERLGNQSIVIENKPGGGGIVAVTSVTRAQPDGHTLLSTIDPPIVATPSLVKSVPYDPLKDLVPVAMLGDGGDNVLLVPASSPLKSVKELVAALRANPEGANYSSSGNGGPGHLLGELFNRQANTKAMHIPHKGSTDALNALLANRVTFAFIPVGLALPHIQAGKVRALAVAAKERNPLLHDLPTVAEAGVPDFSPVHWWIIAFAPANTPKDVVAKLNQAIRQATQSPEVAELLRKQALRPSQDSPEKVAERVTNDVRYWSRLIKELGITAG
jgi:tripartite-type tricarboxylate transporter receptor subunit TctC